jgi:general secretion pathway protein N
MKPGRAFSVLTGVALLGGIARFNEMTPAAQAALFGAAGETAQSWLHSAVTIYTGVTSGTAAQQPAAPAVIPASAPAPAAAGGAAPRRAVTRTAEAEPPPAAGNPLWGMPLRQLSMTRDRPIFSPSRRPPPPPMPAFVAPVAVRTPAKPPEPERPTVSLLGTIIGSSAEDQIAVFLDTATQSVVRLRIGEDHQGWVLRMLKSREATLVKTGEQAVVLVLAAPGEAAPVPAGYGPAGVPMPGGILPGMTLPGGMPGAPPGVAPGQIPGMPGMAGVPGGGSTVGTQRDRSRRQQR